MITSLLLCCCLVSAEPGRDNIQHGLRVPPGFEVVEFADNKLADDIYCMTLDPRGRVVVSGRGYLRILVDDDGDGRADRALDFTRAVRGGAMGLLWEKDYFYVTADSGLLRFRVARDQDHAEGPPELIRAVKAGGEHQAHALCRGPDGWLYLIGGDGSGFDKSYATLPTSPIKEPIGGGVVRFRPDLKQSEIVADGFRNAYGMDFNPDGELFTFDSDNERCVSLPWYEPIRFYHVQEGSHHGWLNPQVASPWRLPPYLVDMSAPLATMGRGSPTGVACYRHLQFPAKYRGGFFLLDWTFGRVYFCKLERAGATYRCVPEIFLESVGDSGFAPTAVAVHPGTGDLYLSIGGRGTRGAVYRIRYPRGLRKFGASELAALQPRPRSLDWNPGSKKPLLERAAGADLWKRARALRAISRHREQFASSELAAVIRASAGQTERSIRQATAELLSGLDKTDRQAFAGAALSPVERATIDLGLVRSNPGSVVRQATGLLAAKDGTPELALTASRLLQLGLGGLVDPSLRRQVWAGYSPRSREQARKYAAGLGTAIGAIFPTHVLDVDRELSRLLAVLECDDADLLKKVAAKLTADSDPVEDFHYLIVLARMPGSRPAALTQSTARALLALDAKVNQRHLNRERNWFQFLAELYAGLARRDPALHEAMVTSAEFGRPDHALFALCRGFDRHRAAEIFLARAAHDDDYQWSAEVIRVVGSLPSDRSALALRQLWGKLGLDDVILPVLARSPTEADRARFVEKLSSPQPATVRLCLDALAKLGRNGNSDELLALVRALGRLSDRPEDKPMREQIGTQLQRLTGVYVPAGDKAGWASWLARAHPDLAARLHGADGVDVRAWGRRLGSIRWPEGDLTRGSRVFQKASCAGCHSGTNALGPDLHGVAGRFSRDDVFTAILQPSKDISPRYRATLVATDDGKVYQGMIVYEANDGILLQTGPAQTVRIPGNRIASRRGSDVSLMPVGLLDKLTDREIADLYAYLRSLNSSLAAGTSAQRK